MFSSVSSLRRMPESQASQVKALRGEPVHPGEILVAEQLDAVGHALEQQRAVHLQAGDRRGIPLQHARQAEQRRAPPRQHLVGLVERPVELAVEHPHFEQLHVGELQHGARVFQARTEQQRGVPVDQRVVLRREGDGAGQSRRGSRRATGAGAPSAGSARSRAPGPPRIARRPAQTGGTPCSPPRAAGSSAVPPRPRG